MKADTFARLVTLESLIDAEVGWYLEHRPPASARFREGMISRISDLVDEIDALDAVAAARVYDAVVDFLSELPDGDDDDALVEATLRFKRAVDRVAERGLEPREREEPSTWAVVLDELLGETADAYDEAFATEPMDTRAFLRARYLLNRARDAAERMAPAARAGRRAELRGAMDRLLFAVHSRRLPPAAVDPLIAAAQRMARRHRPSNLSRIGAFVVGQLLRRRAGAEARPVPDPRDGR
jgi:hypothetical protein